MGGLMPKITPVILCGGSGERLWPLSRKSFPKQFLNLIGTRSLFQQAVTRLGDETPPIVITGDECRFIARQQLQEVGFGDADVIIEPEGKNTAPAILTVACHLASKNPQSLMMVMPSDHYIPDAEDFLVKAKEAAKCLAGGQIVCFGVTPKWPETGYGYIRVKETGNIMKDVSAFTEKPDANTAQTFIADGDYLWNAGIFLMRADELLNLAEEMHPEMLRAVRRSILSSVRDLDFLRLDPTEWAKVEPQSFDYSFMEKVSGMGCVRLAGAWSDLGNWQALAREKKS